MSIRVYVERLPKEYRDNFEMFLSLAGKPFEDRILSQELGGLDLEAYLTLVQKAGDAQNEFLMTEVPQLGKTNRNRGVIYSPASVEFYDEGFIVYVSNQRVGQHNAKTDKEVFELLASLENNGSFLGFYDFKNIKPTEWLVNRDEMIVFGRKKPYGLLTAPSEIEVETDGDFESRGDLLYTKKEMKVDEIAGITGLNKSTLYRHKSLFVPGKRGTINVRKFIRFLHDSPPTRSRKWPGVEEVLYNRFGFSDEKDLKKYLSKGGKHIDSGGEAPPSDFPYVQDEWSVKEAVFYLGISYATLKNRYDGAFTSKGKLDVGELMRSFSKDPPHNPRVKGAKSPKIEDIFERISGGESIEKVQRFLKIDDLHKISRPFDSKRKYRVADLLETEFIQNLMEEKGLTEDDVRERLSDLYSDGIYASGSVIEERAKILKS